MLQNYNLILELANNFVKKIENMFLNIKSLGF